jgi:uncharacterized protein (TIGR02118 family)
MPFVTYTAYPNTGTFDIDYYSTKHVAIVERLWKDKGLQEYRVVSFAGDENTPYIALAELVWKDAQAYKTATLPENGVGELIADVPNFTNIQPVFFAGNETAQHTF